MEPDISKARFSGTNGLESSISAEDDFAPGGTWLLKQGERTERTRASDDEGEQDFFDFPNGSVVRDDVETIQGTLSYDPSPTGTSDFIDWYKVPVTAIDETSGAFEGVRNISVHMVDITDGNDGYDDLYEYSEVGLCGCDTDNRQVLPREGRYHRFRRKGFLVR
jgi:hypothetical protein